jgi:hypothetical protein
MRPKRGRGGDSEAEGLAWVGCSFWGCWESESGAVKVGKLVRCLGPGLKVVRFVGGGQSGQEARKEGGKKKERGAADGRG